MACDPYLHKREVFPFAVAAILLPCCTLAIIAVKAYRHWRSVVHFGSFPSYNRSLRQSLLYGLGILLADGTAVLMRLGCSSFYFSSNEAVFRAYYGPYSCNLNVVATCVRVPQVLLSGCLLLLVLVWRNIIVSPKDKLPVTGIVGVATTLLFASQLAMVLMAHFKGGNTLQFFWPVSNAIMGAYLLFFMVGGLVFARRLELRLRAQSLAQAVARTRRQVGRIAVLYASLAFLLIAGAVFNLLKHDTIASEVGFWTFILMVESAFSLLFVVAIRSPVPVDAEPFKAQESSPKSSFGESRGSRLFWNESRHQSEGGHLAAPRSQPLSSRTYSGTPLNQGDVITFSDRDVTSSTIDKYGDWGLGGPNMLSERMPSVFFSNRLGFDSRNDDYGEERVAALLGEYRDQSLACVPYEDEQATATVL